MTQEFDIVNGLHLTGRISTTSTNSSVNIVRSGIDEVVLDPSLHAHQGQTLAIRQEGELLPLSIDGPDKVVSGQGTIANNLVLSGEATIAPGASPGVLTVDGDVSLGLGSKLAIEVGGTTPGVDYDSLIVGGDLDLSGAILELQFINDSVPEIGQTFQILQAGSLTGMFANATSLYRTAEQAFLVSYENGALGLEATSLPAVAFGDFNSDGLVDAADYIVWRNAVGDTGYDLTADANADAVVNGADYAIWKSHYGSQVPAGAIVAPATVPEPATGLFAVGLLALVSGMRSLRLRKPGC